MTAFKCKRKQKRRFGTCHEFYRTREMPLLPTAQCGVGKTMLKGFPRSSSFYCDLLYSCPIVFLVFVGPELGAGVGKLVLRPNPPCHQFLSIKFYWNIIMFIYSHTCGCFHSAMADMRNCYRDTWLTKHITRAGTKVRRERCLGCSIKAVPLFKTDPAPAWPWALAS